MNILTQLDGYPAGEHERLASEQHQDYSFHTGRSSAMIEADNEEEERQRFELLLAGAEEAAKAGQECNFEALLEPDEGAGKQRYYVNKLYQPLNKDLCQAADSSQPPSPLVERDQEHLLYQGLKFLECDEPTQGNHQLTKILVDDEAGDEQLQLEQMGREDPLERLQLTTIIDAFDSFPSSPLVDSSKPAPDSRPEVAHTNRGFERHQLCDFGSQQAHYAEQALYAGHSEGAPSQRAPSESGSSVQVVSSSFRPSPASTGDGSVLTSQPDSDSGSTSSSVGCGARKRKNEEQQARRAAKKRLVEAAAKLDDERSDTPNKVSSSYEKLELIDDLEFSMDDETSSSGTDRAKQPQMSIYRRRTANARERIRMRAMNQAYEKLKKVVPIEMLQQASDEQEQAAASGCNGAHRRGATGKSSASPSANTDCSQSVKLTKITTLRLAVSYIAKLSEVLRQHPEGNVRSNEPVDQSSPTSARQSADGNQSAPGKSELDQSSGSRPRGSLGQQARKRRQRTTSGASCARPDNLGPHPPVQEPTGGQRALVSAMPQQQAPLLLAGSNLLSGQQQANAFVPIHQPKPQIAYQQDGRTFVTPVTVAILGIPNQQTVSESPQSTLQLVTGLQQAGQQHRPQPLQSGYSLVSQQPQQVTLTLDELNGLSVLRLANPSASLMSSNHPSIQLQSNRSQFVKQQPAQLVSAGQSYNLAPYPSTIQIAQVQTQNGLQHILHQSGPGLQLNLEQAPTNEPLLSSGQARLNMATTNVNLGALPVTGNNSDCKGAHGPNHMLAGGNNCQLFKLHQNQTLNGGGHHFLANQTLMAISPSGQLYQTSASAGQPSLIYLNAATGKSVPGNASENNFDGQARQCSLVKLAEENNGQSGQSDSADSSLKAASEANIRQLVASLTTSIHNPLDKSDRLRSAQVGPTATSADLKYHYQANERLQAHLPAQSLAKGQQQLFGLQQAGLQLQHLRQQQQQQNQQQQSQPKKTYRFHNYDGNMISNHLYSSSSNSNNHTNNNNSNNNNNNNNGNHDKQSQQNKGRQEGGASEAGQRSRQNSLSSTCSTTSTLCSSVASSSPGASITPIPVAIKGNGSG